MARPAITGPNPRSASKVAVAAVSATIDGWARGLTAPRRRPGA